MFDLIRGTVLQYLRDCLPLDTNRNIPMDMLIKSYVAKMFKVPSTRSSHTNGVYCFRYAWAHTRTWFQFPLWSMRYAQNSRTYSPHIKTIESLIGVG